MFVSLTALRSPDVPGADAGHDSAALDPGDAIPAGGDDSWDATELGYLLHKHPDKVQRFDVPFGRAYVFYPEATPQRCTAALLLDVDPVGLVRRQGQSGKGRPGSGSTGRSLAEYVNDRPYAASSLLSVTIARVFGSALHGRCEAKPDLAGTPLNLEIRLPALPADPPARPSRHEPWGEPEEEVTLVHQLFEPLGWQVATTRVPLDPYRPDWGASRYVDTTLTGRHTVADALSHVYVLLPVLDDAKHYWVGTDEIDKLIRTAGGWLADHPARPLITQRYLVHQRTYVDEASARLERTDGRSPSAGTVPPRGVGVPDGQIQSASPDASLGTALRPTLRRERVETIVAELRRLDVRRVIDLGCGEGDLLAELLRDPSYTEIVGVDVSTTMLDRAERRLGLERLPDRQRDRISLLQASATYRDARLAGYDVIVLAEVIEHLDPERLPALESTVFGTARPGAVLVTTPNAEYNIRYEGLADDEFRHDDHRFEWDREEFAAWTARVGGSFGYDVRLVPVGPQDAAVGSPTQLAVFTRIDDVVPDVRRHAPELPSGRDAGSDRSS